MHVELFALCDYAQESAGKLTALGIFDAISVREFPAIHPILCLCARIRFPVYELGQRSIHVEISDNQGQHLVPPLDGRVSIDGIGGDSACANVTLTLFNIKMERECSWRVSLSVDGQERAAIPLYIRKHTSARA